MELGSSLGPKTEVSNFGIRKPEALNLCFRATRTLSFQWLLVQCPLRAEVCSLLARAICAQGFGSTRTLDRNRVSLWSMIIIKCPILDRMEWGFRVQGVLGLKSFARHLSHYLPGFWGVVIVKSLLKFREKVIWEAS